MGKFLLAIGPGCVCHFHPNPSSTARKKESVESESRSIMSNSLQPHGLYVVREILQARILEWVAFPFYRGSSQSDIEPRAPIFWADSLPAEPQGNPKNTGVSSLSLLQGIFLTQGLNPGLPHCRWILYQLGHQGSPKILEWVAYPFSRGTL